MSTVSSKMFIPKTITTGYNTRGDTYTKKLAYVIYTDNKGVLRKEASWQSWRDKKIDPETFDNTPQTGFVLNKKVGGHKYDWNVRQTYVRVYDPRGFELEITVPNLLFILQETSAIQGKGLEGEFVYAWHGTELVLLPTCSAEYKACSVFTGLQSGKVTKSDMVEGCSYVMKDTTPVMYLGRHSYCEKVGYDQKTYNHKPVGFRHIFLRLDKQDDTTISRTGGYIIQTGFTKIATKTSTEALPEYAAAYDKFVKSRYCNLVVAVKMVKQRFLVPSSASYHIGVILEREGDKFFPVVVRKSYSRTYGRAEAYEYETVRGVEFTPTVEDGVCRLTELPSFYGKHWNSPTPAIRRISEEELLRKEAYKAVLVTAKGDEFDLIRNDYYC